MATYARGLKCSSQLARVVLWIVVAICGDANSIHAQDRFSEYDLLMYEPLMDEGPSTLPSEVKIGFAAGLKELWFKALQRPDAELQRMVIDSLAIAQRQGMPGLDEARPRLLELLDEPNQSLDVVRAIAQALIALDARDQAETLAKLSSKHGVSVGQIVEPALAKWKSPVLHDAWLKRVQKASAGQTQMILAMEGLSELSSDQATAPLKKVVLDAGETIQTRLAAAHALGKTHSTGMDEFAKSLVDAPSRPDELNSLLALEVLARHDDANSLELLTKLLSSHSTAVQSRSLDVLFHIDIDLVDRHAERLIDSVDVNVRRWCARAMIGKQDVGRIQMLCSLLNDVNPSLRREVANGLLKLADDPMLRDAVIKHAHDIANQDAWRGCEQAVVVLTKLDHKPSGQRMVELLGHARGEVQVASAWGLTRLKVKKWLPEMLDHAESVFEGFRAGQLNDDMPGASLHIGHLFIAFGDQRYHKAEFLLRKYLPKDFSLGTESRAAAAWAIGMLHEDDPQADLVRILLERLNDPDEDDPEDPEMQAMCAMSLGRMNAQSALPDLRRARTGGGYVRLACDWAIERMTGETVPQTKRNATRVDNWFLMPIKDE